MLEMLTLLLRARLNEPKLLVGFLSHFGDLSCNSDTN